MARSARKPGRKLGLLTSVVILVGAAGCGGGFSDDKGAAGDSTGEVRMLVNITPNLTKSYWEGLVKPFEDANPGVDVKIEAPTGSGVKDTLPQLLAAGNAPDVVETLMADKVLAPQMLDLTDQAWTKDTPLVEQASLDGKVYTVGVGQQAQSLVFYNKDAFAKAGISAPPKDLDELTADMGKLKSAGYLPLQTAGDYVTGLQLLQLSDPSIATKHPDTVKPLPLEVLHDFPTGAKRIKEPAQGIYATFVNGEMLMKEGEHTGNLPGRVLRNTYYKANHA